MNWAELLSRVPRPARVVAQEIVVVGVSLGVVLLSYPTGLRWSEAAAIVACAALPLRLKWPWLAMLCCLLGLAGQLGLAPALFGLYRIGRTSRSLWVITAWVVAAVAAIETAVFLTNHLSPRDGTMSVLFATLWIVSPSALGMLLTTRQRLASSLADLRLAREAELDTRAERARSAERRRIGREIHDAVGHHATLIAVEAAALEATTAEPETKMAAQRIRDLAKASLGEMRSALGLVDDRPTNGDPPNVADLVARARQAGMNVDYDAVDVEVAPPIGRALFRIVQESLTNAAKHAPGSPVRVSITRDATALTVTTTNGPPTTRTTQDHPVDRTTPDHAIDRTTPDHAIDDGGLGLPGMAERANSIGGHLHIDREPTGTFTVRAHLPLDGYLQSKVDATEPTIDGTEAALDVR
jgi:signal transduction histidine kinase